MSHRACTNISFQSAPAFHAVAGVAADSHAVTGRR